MDVEALVIDRLKSGKQPWLDVSGLLAFSELSDSQIKRTPALFVVPVSEQPSPDVRGSGRALHDIKLTVGVIIIEKLINQHAPDLAPIRYALRRQLFGWSASDKFEPFTLGGGQLLNVAQRRVAWIDKFITEYTEDANRYGT